MQRLWPRTYEQQIQYHLDDGRSPNFTVGQAGRVELAHFLIDKILRKDLTQRPLRFVELGCGSGDVTGPYAGVPADDSIGYWTGIEVIGYDVVPGAKAAAAARFPEMKVHIGTVEGVEPFDCDLLVMTEFLEHLYDPWTIVRAWMPKAHFAIIGHPLNEPSPPIETGHLWSYTLADWHAWFEQTGHGVWERFVFPMGSFPEMIMGHGSRRDLPPWV